VPFNGSDRDTVCPLDLERQLTDHRVPQILAERLHVPQDVIVAELREFVGYWTTGAGAGQTRSQWPRKAREHIRKRVQSGQATPPGAVEHRARTGRGHDAPTQVAPSVYAEDFRRGMQELQRKPEVMAKLEEVQKQRREEREARDRARDEERRTVVVSR
jgi:hypothetical protein